MQEQFDVLNIKCGGCINTIRDGLSELDGVNEVTASLDGEVSVEGAALDRAVIAEKLASLGFPEA